MLSICSLKNRRFEYLSSLTFKRISEENKFIEDIADTPDIY